MYDRRFVFYVIRDNTNDALAFEIADTDIKKSSWAHLLFHSDREFQYANRNFYAKLEMVGMTHDVSKVAKCINNELMKGVL